MDSATLSRTDAGYDAGLRNFLLAIYNRMGIALLVTAALAWVAAHDPVRHLLFTTTANGRLGYTVLGWIVSFAPLAIIGGMGLTGQGSTRKGSSFMLWSTAALFGLSLGTIVIKFTGVTLGLTFLITATSFGALSLFGYVTKINLNAIGGFLMYGLFGLIILMLFAMFTHTPAIALGIPFIGILIFAGFIAYDTQKMKEFYSYGLEGDDRQAVINTAALSLYLDFVNIFLFILQLFGRDNDD